MTAEPRTVRVRANGGEFRGLEWPGTGPLAVLVHATSFCAEVWRPVWSAARSAGADGVRAVAVDQRGHGLSFAPAEPAAYGWDLLAEDVVAVVEALRGARARGRALLVGHSSGATACLAAAGLRPELVAGVAAVEPVLFESPADSDGDSFAGSRALAERARGRRPQYESRSAARRMLEGRFPYSGFPPASMEAFLAGGMEPREDGTVALRCAPDVEAWAYEGAAALDLWPRVVRISAPVLVLAAEHTAMPPALLDRLRGSLPDVRVERVAGATHFAALERPEAVGALLGSFASELGEF